MKIAELKFHFLLIRVERRKLNVATVIRVLCLFIPIRLIFLRKNIRRILLRFFLVEDEVWRIFMMRFDIDGVINGEVGMWRIRRAEMRRDRFMFKGGVLMPKTMSIVVGVVYWLIRMHIVIFQE